MTATLQLHILHLSYNVFMLQLQQKVFIYLRIQQLVFRKKNNFLLKNIGERV